MHKYITTAYLHFKKLQLWSDRILLEEADDTQAWLVWRSLLKWSQVNRLVKLQVYLHALVVQTWTVEGEWHVNNWGRRGNWLTIVTRKDVPDKRVRDPGQKWPFLNPGIYYLSRDFIKWLNISFRNLIWIITGHSQGWYTERKDYSDFLLWLLTLCK